MRKVHELAWPLRAYWYFIGIKLEIDPGTLEATDKDNKASEDCFRKMFTEWLRHDKPKPTRLALKRSLESVLGMYNTMNTKS